MAGMSRTSSASSVQGFSILQPTLGAPLSFLPAVGTKELDLLIDAYLPGPASAQEKRAAVALEFFEYSARTAQNFKYFAVNALTTANSPTGVSPSPVMSEMTYASSSQASTPATPASKTSRAAKRPETTDFSHLPGMRIITVDGQDVTNNVSRGCKTKEQRDHAHLMRILKACDACKKKKIRCDPSHKKRSASQVESGKSASAKPAKKSKKSSASTATPKSQSTAFTPAPEVDYPPDLDASLEDFTTTMADWDQYFTFNEPIDAALPQDFYNEVPQDFNFFFEPEAQFSPATSGSSAVSPAQPLTPTSSGVIAQTDFTFDDGSFTTFAPSDVQEAMLPYLAAGAHGSNYLDFNLFSPSAGFIDEEPRKLKAGEKRKATASPMADLNEPRSIFAGTSNNRQHSISDSSSIPLTSAVPAWDIAGGQHALSGEFEGGYASAGLQLPFHEDVHDNVPRATAEALLYDDLQPPSGINLPVASELVEDRSRALLRQGRNLRSTHTGASASTLLRGVSPSTGSEVLVRPTGDRAQLTTPLTGTSPVLPLLDGQRRQSQLQTPSTPTTLPPLSSSTVTVSGRPFPLDHRVPAGLPTAGLTGVPTGVLTSVDRLRPSAIQGPQAPLVNPVPSGATRIQTSTAVPLAGPARGDSSLQQSAVDCTNANVQNLSRSTGLGAGSSQGLIARHSLPESQLSEKVESPLDAVLSLTSPVQQSLVGSTTIPLSVLAELAVFGLVSLLLIVAVTSDLQQLQGQPQLQYPVFASIPLSTMMISFFLSTWSNQQDNQSSSQKPVGVLSSVRNLLKGLSSSSSSSPTAASSPRRRRRGDSWSHSSMITTRRVIACF